MTFVLSKTGGDLHPLTEKLLRQHTGNDEIAQN
jgi:hypothetical protein